MRGAIALVMVFVAVLMAGTAQAQEAEFIGFTRHRLNAPSPVVGGNFGGSVTVDGDVVFVGEIRTSGRTGGVVHRYERSPMGWSRRGEIRSSTPVPGFGQDLQLVGDTLFVGAQREEFTRAGRPGKGVVYVFARDAGGPNAWGQIARILNPTAELHAQFGYSIAYDGTWLVISSLHAIRDGESAGAVYVYARESAGFRQVALLDRPEPHLRDLYGSGVAVSDNQIAVTDPRGGSDGKGRVHLFRYDSATRVWRLTQSLAPEPDCPSPCTFSFKVGMYKTTLFASSQADDKIHWFTQNAGAFARARLIAPRAAPDFTVANWLDFSPGLLIASGAAASGGVGEAYVLYQHFPTRGTGWGRVATLTPGHSLPNTGFGQPVAIASRTAVVGAALDGTAAREAGAAYIYDLNFATPPRFDSSPVTAARVGELYSYALTASDPDGEALEFSAAALPAWLTLTSTGVGTATLSGTPGPGDEGTVPVVLTVRDTSGRTAEQRFNLVTSLVVVPTSQPANCGCVAAGRAPDFSWIGALAALALLLLPLRRLRYRRRPKAWRLPA